MVEHLPPGPNAADKVVEAGKRMAASTKMRMASLKEALAEKFSSSEDDKASDDEKKSDDKLTLEEESQQEDSTVVKPEVSEESDDSSEEGESETDEDVNDEDVSEEECELQELLQEADEMLRVQSKEIDRLKQKIRSLEEKPEDEGETTSLRKELHLTFNEGMTLMGISLLWLVALIGADKYLSIQMWVVGGTLPADLVSWSIGSGLWAFHVLSRLDKAKTFLAMPFGMRAQTGLGVCLAVGTALMLSKEEFSTVTNVWAYGSVFALLVLLVSGFGGAFKRAISRRLRRPTISE